MSTRDLLAFLPDPPWGETNPRGAGWLRPCPRHSPNRPSAGHSGPTLDGTGSDGPRTARALTPGARGDGRAAGASGVSCVEAGGYVPGVVTRPFTSERLAASPACSPSCAARSSSVDSVAFLASAVALA